MRQRNTGTLALTAGLCLLAMACGDSDSTEDEPGDGVAAPVGEAADGVLLSGPPPPDPGEGDPNPNTGGSPTGYYSPWGYGGGYGGSPWGYGTPGGYGTPSGHGGPWGYGGGPWGGGAWGGGYGGPWGGGYGGPWGGGAWGGGYGGPYGGGWGGPYGGGYGGPYGGGWGGAYGPQSTRQVQASMADGLDPGVSEIPWVGNWRGGGINAEEYVVSCAPGRIAVGFYGRADNVVDQIGLVCADVLPGGILGTQDLYGPVGGEGGDYFIDKCPDGYAVAGFAGRADLVVDQLRLVCDKVAPVPLFYGKMFGGVGGKEWQDISPGGFFLTEIRGRSGAQIEGLQSVHRFVKA